MRDSAGYTACLPQQWTDCVSSPVEQSSSRQERRALQGLHFDAWCKTKRFARKGEGGVSMTAQAVVLSRTAWGSPDTSSPQLYEGISSCAYRHIFRTRLHMGCGKNFEVRCSISHSRQRRVDLIYARSISMKKNRGAATSLACGRLHFMLPELGLG